MATWFTVVGRVAQIDSIADSLYKNALIEFEEGDSNFSSCRSFYVALFIRQSNNSATYCVVEFLRQDLLN
jgi:hypothetical protein